jgi:dedicator of cytokinesis protein 3
MWRQKTQRAAFSRNSPISKLNALSEQSESQADSRDGPPPNTAGSRGPAVSESKSALTSHTVIRTVGMGAIKLNHIMKQDEEVEQLMSVWTPSINFSEDKQDYGDGWEDVIRDLMESKSNQYEKSRKAERLQIHLKAFDSPGRG